MDTMATACYAMNGWNQCAKLEMIILLTIQSSNSQQGQHRTLTNCNTDAWSITGQEYTLPFQLWVMQCKPSWFSYSMLLFDAELACKLINKCFKCHV